jgi:hypothetical protein
MLYFNVGLITNAMTANEISHNVWLLNNKTILKKCFINDITKSTYYPH